MMREPPPGIEALREAYRKSLPESSLDCPSDERLAALILGELAERKRIETADHVVRCRRCVESYRLLREVHEKAKAPDRPLWSRPSLRISAVVLLLLGARLLARYSFLPSSFEGSDVPRGAPGATGYRVRLFDAGAELLWE